MNLSKSLLLGATAGFAAVAGANAADLPSRKAAPVAYVKICDAYGAGFFYIPGTDTCLRVSGRVRAEYTYIPARNIVGIGSNVFPAAGKAGTTIAPTFQVAKSGLDTTGFLARGVVILDARTQTPWGTARTYISLRGQNATGLYPNNALAGTVTGQTGGATITVERAFVQFAGFTFGRSAEVFSFMPAYNYISHSGASFPAGINLLAYTATFGGGFSATIALEDRAGLNAASNPNGIVNAFTQNAAGAAGLGSLGGVAVANGPMTWPALVGNLRLDQGWGAVQVMGAVVQNSAVVTRTGVSSLQSVAPPAAFPFAGAGVFSTPVLPGLGDPLLVTGGNAGSAITKIGWAIGAGLKFNLPMLAAGDELNLTAAYADGALDWIAGNSTSARTANIGREFGGLIRTDRNLTVFPTSYCGVAAGANAGATTPVCSAASEQTKGWQVAAYFTHYWTPTVRQNFLASYLSITPGNMTRNTDWQFGGLSKANVWEIGTSWVWSPAKDFDIGVEVTYAKLNQSLASFPGFAPSVSSGANSFTGPNNSIQQFRVSPAMIQTRLRVERTF